MNTVRKSLSLVCSEYPNKNILVIARHVPTPKLTQNILGLGLGDLGVVLGLGFWMLGSFGFGCFGFWVSFGFG